MKLETRANLIFLFIFLCLTLPGAVVLFKKKLDPAAPPMFMPDYVRRRLPYIASQQAPAQVERYVPEKTGQWVTGLNRDHGGGAEVLMPGRQPLISDDRKLQVTQIHCDAGRTTVYLIVWDADEISQAPQNAPQVVVGGADFTGAVATSQVISLPAPIKQELMNEGVIQPPHSVTFLTLTFPHPLCDTPFTLQVLHGNSVGAIRVPFLKD